jgi:hypothetical protein
LGQQQEIFDSTDLWKETIETKLAGLLETNQFYNFTRCGRDRIFRTCRDCGDWTAMDYRCTIKWCPRCNYRLGLKRRQKIELWSQEIDQPKHVVLTCRNFPILTRKKFRDFSGALAQLRRRSVFAKVSGGTASIETTNESNGWHVHAHMLLDARWIDIRELAVVWGKLVGQEYGIVHIKDVRAKSFLQEVCKYVVKGSEMAKWPAEQILEFVTAVKGVRNFFVFGSLFNRSKRIQAKINLDAPEKEICKCGCNKFIFRDERTEIIIDAEKSAKKRR